ncbi:MAG: helix-turn-helix domain-containing protein [Planctomycetaceae bacterium]|jgi:DNA-binding XRE family transcriptional regulator|nr:helix-turn-helix domain-containing protein [Planctomycetaceae bacterium]
MPTQVLKNRPKTGMQSRRSAVKRKTTADAADILYEMFVSGDPEAEAYMVEERERIIIGSQIYDLRTKAGMTQTALAKKAGTTAAAISRLEDADYEGHSLPMLRKIAAVFGTCIDIQFVPKSE